LEPRYSRKDKFFPRKVPLIIHRLQPKLTSL